MLSEVEDEVGAGSMVDVFVGSAGSRVQRSVSVGVVEMVAGSCDVDAGL